MNSFEKIEETYSIALVRMYEFVNLFQPQIKKLPSFKTWLMQNMACLFNRKQIPAVRQSDFGLTRTK